MRGLHWLICLVLLCVPVDAVAQGEIRRASDRPLDSACSDSTAPTRTATAGSLLTCSDGTLYVGNGSSWEKIGGGGGANPAGEGSELQYRSSATEFGAVTGSSWDGTTLTLPASVSGPTSGDFVLVSPNAATATRYVKLLAGDSSGDYGGGVELGAGDGLYGGGGFTIMAGAVTGGAGGTGASFAGIGANDQDGDGAGTSIDGGYFTITAGSATGTNIAGLDSTLTGSTSTGNAAGGAIIMRAAAAGASGSDANAPAEVFRITGLGAVFGGTAGVRASAADGVLTLLGLGDGADENLTVDFDNAGLNIVGVGSTSGVSDIAFSLALLVGTDGVRLAGTNGRLRLSGRGDGTDEDLDFNFNTANVVNVSSFTGVTKVDFDTITLEADYNSSDGTAGLTQTCSAAVTAVTIKDGLITAITCS